MSTYLGEKPSKILKSEDDLKDYFHAFAKPESCVKVGLEAEFFAVDRISGKAYPYEGGKSIHAILKQMAQSFGYEPVLEDGNIIALKGEGPMVTLEPGGQVELSAPPAANVFDVESQLKTFLDQLRAVRGKIENLEWLAAGMQPFSALEEITWVPKKRYAIMARHMGERDPLSHEMMKRTATNQVNFDYLNEEDAMDALKVVIGITSVVSAMFANSSFSDGRLNGFASKRLDIWEHTDRDRTGLLLEFLEPGKRFSDYLRYLLDMPMMFLVRRGEWVPAGNLSFREFIRRGFQGYQATQADFELHLSTAFPEARFKQYLEIRGVDCQSPELIPAVAAFWKGILYDSRTREQAWALVAGADTGERLRFHRDAARLGLQASFQGVPALDLAKELVNLSCASLAKQKKTDGRFDECVYLDRIREKILAPGRSPGEQLAERWLQEFHQDPTRLIESLSIG